MTRRERVKRIIEVVTDTDYHLSASTRKSLMLEQFDLIDDELHALWAILDTIDDYDKGGTKDGYDAIWAAISEYNNELGGV